MSDQGFGCSLPVIVLASAADSQKSDSVMAQLLSDEAKLNSSDFVWVPGLDGVKGYKLPLETRYYTVETLVCRLLKPTVGSAEFAENVEAVILHYSDDVGTLDDHIKRFEGWMSFIKHWDPQVKLLTCDCVATEHNDGVTQWCAQNHFELVELNPNQSTIEELEEYRECYGYARIRQILKAHSWPNLVMKSDDGSRSRMDRLQKLLCEDDEDASDLLWSDLPERTTAESTEKPEDDSAWLPVYNCNASSKPGEQDLTSNTTADESASIDNCADDNRENQELDFEELFAKFASFKAQAETMPQDQRKAYAEKVTVAFWKAIGGEDGEIDGLDSDDDCATLDEQ